jgi:hypothetical protein
MPRPDILGIKAFGTGSTLQEWWQWALVAIFSASGLVGLVAFLWYSYRSIRALLKVRLEVCLTVPIAYKLHRATPTSTICHDRYKNGYNSYRTVRVLSAEPIPFPQSRRRLAYIWGL